MPRSKSTLPRFPGPTDEQYDQWVTEDLEKLHARALEKTGTDESEVVGEAQMVYGPRIWNVSGSEVYFKTGKDGVVRYTPIGVTVINFTQHQIVSYGCALDTLTGNPVNEQTDEYFYRDVVSVQTQTTTLTWDKSEVSTIRNTLLKEMVQKEGKLQLNASETFELTTSGGTSVKVFLRNHLVETAAGKGRIDTSRAEKAIQVVRKMLRDKKSA